MTPGFLKNNNPGRPHPPEVTVSCHSGLIDCDTYLSGARGDVGELMDWLHEVHTSRQSHLLDFKIRPNSVHFRAVGNVQGVGHDVGCFFSVHYS